MHNELDDEKEVLFKYLKKNTEHVLTTNNQQSPWYGLTQMIEKLYCESKVIVKSKLHGAITAYSLGIPYIAFPIDKKLEDRKSTRLNYSHLSILYAVLFL